MSCDDLQRTWEKGKETSQNLGTLAPRLVARHRHKARGGEWSLEPREKAVQRSRGQEQCGISQH